MGKIAHLKVACPQCGKYTSIYVEEGGSSAKVKCEHCKQIFEFGSGMMYEPVAYVSSIPQWAVISAAESKNVYAAAVQCKKCGKSYDEGDVALDTATGKGNYAALDPSNPAFRKLLGFKTLLKCSYCSAISCSDCASESEGIIKMACPFCKTDYTIYSFIKPTAENVLIGSMANERQTKIPTAPTSRPEPVRTAAPLPANYNVQAVTPTQVVYPNKRKGLAIGLWFVGAFGFWNIHNFYLGKVKIGLIKLVMYIVFFSIGQSLGLELPPLRVIAQLLMGCVFVWNLVDLVKIIKLPPGAFGGFAR